MPHYPTYRRRRVVRRPLRLKNRVCQELVLSSDSSPGQRSRHDQCSSMRVREASSIRHFASSRSRRARTTVRAPKQSCNRLLPHSSILLGGGRIGDRSRAISRELLVGDARGFQSWPDFFAGPRRCFSPHLPLTRDELSCRRLIGSRCPFGGYLAWPRSEQDQILLAQETLRSKLIGYRSHTVMQAEQAYLCQHPGNLSSLQRECRCVQQSDGDQARRGEAGKLHGGTRYRPGGHHA